jgi:hypothetical protein
MNYEGVICQGFWIGASASSTYAIVDIPTIIHLNVAAHILASFQFRVGVVIAVAQKPPPQLILAQRAVPVLYFLSEFFLLQLGILHTFGRLNQVAVQSANVESPGGCRVCQLCVPQISIGARSPRACVPSPFQSENVGLQRHRTAVTPRSKSAVSSASKGKVHSRLSSPLRYSVVHLAVDIRESLHRSDIGLENPSAAASALTRPEGRTSSRCSSTVLNKPLVRQPTIRDARKRSMHARRKDTRVPASQTVTRDTADHLGRV